MPSINKSERREQKRRKAIDAKFQGVRYNALRAGQSLTTFEAERKTTLKGKVPKRTRGKK